MQLSTLHVTYIWTALASTVLMVWGQQIHPTVTPDLPPPPTMNPVINSSVVVFVGEPVIVPEGIRVTIDCGPLIDAVAASTGIANPMVTWYKNGAVLTTGIVINVEISDDSRMCIITGTLMALGSQVGTDGNYSCEVCSTPTQCVINETDLVICGESHIMEPMGPPPVAGPFTTVTCGQDVTFPDLTGTEFILMECRAFNGTPPLTMAVYKDGELIPGASFPYTIAGADRDAFGTYTFVLSTEICDTDTAVINVLRQGTPPDIDEGPFIPLPPSVPPGDMEVQIGSPGYVVDGSDVTIVCDILSGTRPITISWFRNGAPDPTRGNVSTITVTDYNDGDELTCRADNDVGFDEKSTTINVFNQRTGSESSGTISAGSTSSSFSIDIVNDMIQERNETFDIAIKLFTSCLSISLGNSSARVMIIDDDIDDAIGGGPPVIAGGQCIPQPEVIPNGDVTVMIGSPAHINDGNDLTLACRVDSGLPPINISWYRNGMLDSSKGNTSTITIANVDIDKDNGAVYTCRADNDKGHDEQHTIVDVFTPLCSHEVCRTRNNILCIIPDSTCLCKRQMGYCSAAYYSTDTRSIPATCTQCSNPTDLSCVKNWSGCVKRSDEAAHGRPRRLMKTAANFKIYSHPC